MLLFGKFMLYVLLVVIFVVALIILDDNSSTNDSTSENSYINQTSTTGTTSLTKYDLTDFGMEVRAPINMVLTNSANDLIYLFGEEADSFYEFALYNESDLISCFTQDTDSETVDNYYESLKQSFVNSDYSIISDFKKETISGFDFTTLEAQFELDGVLYNDLCLGYFLNDRFVFFEYTFPSENASRARTVVEEMIYKVK